MRDRHPLADRVFAAVLHLMPASRRDDAERDLREEAAVGGRGSWWCTWQVVRMATPFAWSLSVDRVVADLRYVLRGLRQARGFTVSGVLVFALGVGVNVAVFSTVDRLLFRPLPYADPDQLFVLEEYSPETGQGYGTMPALYAVESRARIGGIVDLFPGVPGSATANWWTTPEPGDEAPIALNQTTFNALDVLGVAPILGRPFREADVEATRRPILISYELWQRRFGGREDVLGTTVWQDPTRPGEIVGVLPSGFIEAGQGLDPNSDGLALDRHRLAAAGSGERMYAPIVRLARGASPGSVQAEITALARGLVLPVTTGQPASPTNLRLVPLADSMFSQFHTYLWLVVSAAGLVLLVACANLASLFLIRRRKRAHVTAMQMALGASRRRVLGTAVLEGLVLAVAGTAVALGVLWGVSESLRQSLPPIFSRFAASAIDLRVLGFAGTSAVASALLASLLPAWRSTRVDPVSVLRGVAEGRSTRRITGRGLLAAEAAVGLVLVLGAALAARTLIGLTTTELGFEPDGLYSVTVRTPRELDAPTRYRALTEAGQILGGYPGVVAHAASEPPPIWNVVGNPFGAGVEERDAFRWRITEGFIRAAGMTLIAGREFEPDEVASGARVAILNERGLSRVWPGVAPAAAIGRMLRFDGEEPWQVVGVVEDVAPSYASRRLTSLYVPASPEGSRFLWHIVRLAPGQRLSLPDVRDRLRAAGIPFRSVEISSFTADLAEALRDHRFRTLLFAAFGLTALLLAVVGLYAVTDHDVALRRREMGIRFALGADAARVRRLVVGQALAPLVAGLAAGWLVALWLAPLAEPFLHNVDPRDPWTYAGVAGVLFAAGAIAAWLPASRAARTDPAVVLRAN